MELESEDVLGVLENGESPFVTRLPKQYPDDWTTADVADFLERTAIKRYSDQLVLRIRAIPVVQRRLAWRLAVDFYMRDGFNPVKGNRNKDPSYWSDRFKETVLMMYDAMETWKRAKEDDEHSP